ncbi:MAG: NADH-quinone oxidoreductase subunit C [Desulfomicrobium escambiense]|nr:NADH-quinone oxidoreductase subunit C [Desulfomicrobium escambiense]
MLKDEGFRFITMSSTDLGDSICVLYHLDKDLQLGKPEGGTVPERHENCRVFVSVYASAVLIENEIKEHFGVEFDGLLAGLPGNALSATKRCKEPRSAR